jgi:hypothetical protein
MTLSIDEAALIDAMIRKIDRHERHNEVREHYYEGKIRTKDLNISVPPGLKLVNSVVGWPAVIVDVLEERLDFEGWIGGDQLGLTDIFRSNELDLQSSQGHKDALIYGTGFIFVGRGMDGEPDPLITIESPSRATAVMDLRSKRPMAAILLDGDDDGWEGGSLYLPDQTIRFGLAANGSAVEISRDVHNLGRVPCAPLINNPRSGDPWGRSEITRAVMSYTDSAMRTLLGAEVAREFHASPQRYVLGADEEVFLDSDGNPRNAWSVIQGRVLGIPYNDDDGVMPQVGQFQANSPAPYFDAIRAYAQLISAEAGIPPSYMGFQTDNPTSADAIRQMEARLVKRAERRQRQFGRAWNEVARLAIMVRDGALPDTMGAVRPQWRDASTPTRAAATDEVVKLIAAGVLIPDSRVTYGRIGFSDSDIELLIREKQTSTANATIRSLAATATPGAANVQAINRLTGA